MRCGVGGASGSVGLEGLPRRLPPLPVRCALLGEGFRPFDELTGRRSISRPYLDMRVPYEWSTYRNKIGYRNLLRDMKQHLFGSRSYPMTHALSCLHRGRLELHTE